MKKVIIEQNEQVIRLDDIIDEMIIGILWKNGLKSFLIKDHNGNTVALELNKRTTIKHWDKPSHKEYVEKARIELKSIFVFDSPEELAQWLAE